MSADTLRQNQDFDEGDRRINRCVPNDWRRPVFLSGSKFRLRISFRKPRWFSEPFRKMPIKKSRDDCLGFFVKIILLHTVLQWNTMLQDLP